MSGVLLFANSNKLLFIFNYVFYSHLNISHLLKHYFISALGNTVLSLAMPLDSKAFYVHEQMEIVVFCCIFFFTVSYCIMYYYVQ